MSPSMKASGLHGTGDRGVREHIHAGWSATDHDGLPYHKAVSGES